MDEQVVGGGEVVVHDGVPGVDKSRAVSMLSEPADASNPDLHRDLRRDWEREVASVVNAHAYNIDAIMARADRIETLLDAIQERLTLLEGMWR